MPNDKFLNANDTVDLIKTGIGALDDKYSFENVAKSEQFKNYNIFQVSTVGNTTISLNIYINSSSGYSSPITVDWDDGNTETFTNFSSANVTLTHIYTEEKIYNIKILINNTYQYLYRITPTTALLNLAVAITNSGTKIQAGAFQEHYNLKNVILKRIYKQLANYTLPSYCFYRCTRLEQVQIWNYDIDQYYTSPKIHFDSYCFSGCVKLNQIDWQSVAEYGNNCFENCYSLNVPITILSAGQNCFVKNSIQSITHLYTVNYNDVFKTVYNANILYLHNCTSITGQYLNQFAELHLDATTPPTVTTLTLSNTCIIYVPKGTAATYKAASGWSTYADRIVEEGAFDKLSTTGGALTGDVTTTNTTFTSTSLVNKDYVDNNTLQEAITDTNSLPTGANIKDMVYRLATTPVTTNTLTIVGTQTDDVASCVALGMTSAAGGSGTIACTPASPTTIELNNVDTPFVKLVFGENGNAFVYTTAEDFESINTGTYTLKTAGTTTYTYYMGDSVNQTTTEIPTMAYINSLNGTNISY